MARSRFLEGPAQAGKTEAALTHIRDLLSLGAGADSLLVLVPHPALGEPYRHAAAAPDWPGSAGLDVVTLGRLAQQNVATYWPLVAAKAGFAHPEIEPQFLTVETSQHQMARFVMAAVEGGLFDGVNMTPFRIMIETLNNLSRAAINGFSLDEVEKRLVAAWGERHSSRPPMYAASLDVARQFRAYCLEHSLLDFSLQIEVFARHLLREPVFRNNFTGQYHHLVADNLEENYPVAADFIRWLWDSLDSAVLVYDRDGGYRTFLGADPAGMHTLADLCEERITFDTPAERPAPLAALESTLSALLDDDEPPEADANPLDAYTFEFHRFYPQMIEWVADAIAQQVERGIAPSDIAVLVPLLNDSLRFTLMSRLDARGIPAVSHRPSRAVRDEPSARTLLTLTILAHPAWNSLPPALDVADALQHVVGELDPIRAWLLAQIVYHPGRDLGAFEEIASTARDRITYRAGQRYDILRAWLLDYRADTASTPPDHFFSRLFGEVLSQPGFGFHTDMQAGRVVAELVASARKFRQTLYPDGVEDWSTVTQEYVSLVQQGLFGGLYLPSWQQDEQSAVFVAPAHTFLMRNRPVAIQFWLDAGSSLWWERLEQPLTHPYVLMRDYPTDKVWTDEDEFYARQQAMRRVITGLVRRATGHIYISVSNLGEQGYEQRGPLLRVLQQTAQRYGHVEESA
ncbi:hypothetical protein [Aggregatilinea lenta]|uniref:hypothetical protein n=1 Tax=Aggregatilinea lenta TaxID=913108 RepID=UPI0013C31F52|nr:hypothetical protein [Aggregatilinea lenta]